MENIKVAVKGKILTLTIDLSKRLRESGSGKNTIIATTKGNTRIEGTEVVMGLNIYTKSEK
jgi:hypothetical protein